MDDEALARLLQAQEDAAAAAAAQRAAAAAHLRGSQDGQKRLISLVEDAARKAQQYEDEMAQACALSVIPMDGLTAAAEEAAGVSRAMGEEPPLAEQDALAQELLAWFKRDFFHWVNNPPCSACGSGSTQPQGTVAPSPDEAGHGAGRTELYGCPQCASVTRFPRYNDPVKLLETRRGRCGEWANCFTLCCRAAGLEARLAVDLLDHVWTEVWSEAQQRWVHLDPCEAACDKPLLYEAGWGKRLNYVIGVGRHGAVDVTRRYSRDYDDTLRRRGLVLESWLTDYLRSATSRMRAALPLAERQALEARDALEQQDLAAAGRGQLSAEEQQALPARITGDAAWLAARGEDGSSVQRAKGAAAAVPPPGTRYRLAKDEGLAAAQPRRLCGGAVRASGENAPSETATLAADGNPHSKWLDFGGKHGNAWIEYRLPAEQPPHVLDSYALTSANDEPARDPRHVVLEAYCEDTGCWVVLDERRDLHFAQRHQHILLQLGSAGSSSSGGSGRGPAASNAAAAVDKPLSAAPVASRRFRLRVVSVADPAAANSVQLACLDLYGQPEQHLEQPQQGEQPQQQQPAEATTAATPPTAALAALEVQGNNKGHASGEQPADNPWAQLFVPQ